MTAPLLRQPLLQAAIAFLEKIWEPMAHLMPIQAAEEQPCPIPVAVEFGVRAQRRRRPSSHQFY